MRCGINEDIYRVVKHYADAWAANDLKRIIDSYHDEVVFHYAGSNPLSGTHRGKPACLAVLKQVKQKTSRKLIAIRDVLAGEVFGVIVAVEEFEYQGRRSSAGAPAALHRPGRQAIGMLDSRRRPGAHR
jgi:ketosteroid isomerase-like protein